MIVKEEETTQLLSYGVQKKVFVGNQNNLYNRAKHILQKNSFLTTINGTIYSGITPSDKYYYNAWFWDSAIHSMARVYYDPHGAIEDLRFLIASQWRNGHIGHIIFREEHTEYFPTKQFWGTEHKSDSGILSSGIIQPPLLAISLYHMYEIIDNPQVKNRLIKDFLPQVMKYHDYLKQTHDSEKSGLISIYHPWSTGSDNSPAFDSQLQNILIQDIPKRIIDMVDVYRVDNIAGDPESRPLSDDYYRYIYLMDKYSKLGWDYKNIAKETPFAVKDIAVNTIWCYANEMLGKLLTVQGKKEAKKYLRWANETRKAIMNCWIPESNTYANIDVSYGKWKPVIEERFADFMPFLTDTLTIEQVQVLLLKLRDKNKYWTGYPIPSVPIDDPKFELKRYWRGPTWPIVNYFIILGLQRLHKNPLYRDYKKLIQSTEKELMRITLDMIETNGFHENYDPKKEQTSRGKEHNGLGFDSFSWTAAIYILLYNLFYNTSNYKTH